MAATGGLSVLAGWLITRALILVMMATFESFVTGDVSYYWRKVDALSEVGLDKTLNEYPTPVAWMLWLPYGLTGGSKTGYLIAFVAAMMVLDAIFTWQLWRAAGRVRDAAVNFWLIFIVLIGPLTYLRFDLLPAVLVGGALLAARRRPWLAGALTGLGAAIKLWPALLIVPLLKARRGRAATGWAFVGVGFGLALLSLLTGGWKRLVSPLTWQSGRGLQIESIWATPLMLLRIFSPRTWTVDISPFQAYEIFGGGVEILLAISTVATIAGIVVIIVLFVHTFRAGEPGTAAIAMIILATVMIMIITNKTLSPQYLLWAGGPVAALLWLRRDLGHGLQVRIGRLTVQLLALALLTHLVYPTFYDALLGRRPHLVLVIGTVLLTVRNIALVLFTIAVCRLSWTLLRVNPRDGRQRTARALP